LLIKFIKLFPEKFSTKNRIAENKIYVEK
jgi:hypothetical protein